MVENSYGVCLKSTKALTSPRTLVVTQIQVFYTVRSGQKLKRDTPVFLHLKKRDKCEQM